MNLEVGTTTAITIAKGPDGLANSLLVTSSNFSLQLHNDYANARNLECCVWCLESITSGRKCSLGYKRSDNAHDIRFCCTRYTGVLKHDIRITFNCLAYRIHGGGM